MIIRRKYYSDFTSSELEQREYGIVSELHHSGAKRVYKKYVGRARKKLAQKIQDSMDLDEMKRQEAMSKFMVGERVNNPELEKKMIKEAEKRGAKVFDKDIDGIGGSYTFDAKTAKKTGIANEEELGNVKYGIVHPKGKGAEVLGHEVGHVDNAESGKKKWDILGKIKKKINKVANDPMTRGEMNIATYYENNDGAVGLKEGAKRFLKKKAIDIEEGNASRKSLKFLKDSGASKDEIKIAERNLKLAGDTYKYGDKKYYKVPIMNKIQIPSRRPKEKVDLKEKVKELMGEE